MIIIPKEIRICGKLYKIEIDDNLGSAGEFSCSRQIIKIGRKRISEKRQLDTLMHEIIETILVERDARYQLPYTNNDNGDYIFNFNHKEWEHIAVDISDILDQILYQQVKQNVRTSKKRTNRKNSLQNLADKNTK
jgi:hypothetical protein